MDRKKKCDIPLESTLKLVNEVCNQGFLHSYYTKKVGTNFLKYPITTLYVMPKFDSRPVTHLKMGKSREFSPFTSNMLPKPHPKGCTHLDRAPTSPCSSVL